MPIYICVHCHLHILKRIFVINFHLISYIRISLNSLYLIPRTSYILIREALERVTWSVKAILSFWQIKRCLGIICFYVCYGFYISEVKACRFTLSG